MLRREFLSLAAGVALTGVNPETKPEAEPVAEASADSRQNAIDVQILRIDAQIHDCFELTPIDWFEVKPGDEVLCSWNNRPLETEHWWISGKPFWDRLADGRQVAAVPVSRVTKMVPAIFRGLDRNNIPKPMPSK